MSKIPEYKKAGYQLPEMIDPGTRIGVCVEVPDDPGHIRAFLGQLDMLGYWWSWERDDDKRGTLVARVWRDIVDCVRWRMENCEGCGGLPPAIYRWNNGRLEKSYDNGQTWENADGDDPRFNSPVFPPLPGGQVDDRCDAARNGRDNLESAVDQLVADLGTVSGIAGVVAALLALIFLVGITAGAATPLLLAFAAALLTLGSSGLDSAFTAGVYDQYRCILYCKMNASLAFSEVEWQEVLDAVNSEISEPARSVIGSWIANIGPVGLTNSTRTGTNVGTECTDCDCGEWCYTFDFSLGAQGWTGRTGLGYTPIVGVEGLEASNNVDTASDPDIGYRGIYVQREFASSVITSIAVNYTVQRGSFDYNLPAYQIGYGQTFPEIDGVLQNINYSAESDGEHTRLWEGELEISFLYVFLRCSRDQIAPYSYSGDETLHSVTFRGTGTNPFGEDNC